MLNANRECSYQIRKLIWVFPFLYVTWGAFSCDRNPSTQIINIIIRSKAMWRMTLCSVSSNQFSRTFTMLTRPRGYKTFFMLNSSEHEIFPAHKF